MCTRPHVQEAQVRAVNVNYSLEEPKAHWKEIGILYVNEKQSVTVYVKTEMTLKNVNIEWKMLVAWNDHNSVY